jgi:hypothetical protein
MNALQSVTSRDLLAWSGTVSDSALYLTRFGPQVVVVRAGDPKRARVDFDFGTKRELLTAFRQDDNNTRPKKAPAKDSITHITMEKMEKIKLGMTALMNAVESQNEIKVRRCLQAMDEQQANERRGCQHHNGAAAAVDHDDVQHQRPEGSSVNATDAWGRTALMYAAHNGNATIARLLLAHGADVHIVDQFGETALIKACKAERIAMITVLVQHGSGGGAAGDSAAFRQNRYGLSPLSNAQRLDTIYALLRADPSVWTTTTMRRNRLGPPPTTTTTTDIGLSDNERRRRRRPPNNATYCSDVGDDQRQQREDDRPVVALVKRQGNNVFLHRCRCCGATQSVAIVRSGRTPRATRGTLSFSSVETLEMLLPKLASEKAQVE